MAIDSWDSLKSDLYSIACEYRFGSKEAAETRFMALTSSRTEDLRLQEIFKEYLDNPHHLALSIFQSLRKRDKETGSDLYTLSRRAFAALAPILPPDPVTKYPEDFRSAMVEMFETSQGICFGEMHRNYTTVEFLLRHMGFLKELGVTTMFMEMFHMEMQADVDTYLTTDQAVPSMMVRQRIASNEPDDVTLEAGDKTMQHVLMKARKLGLRIIGLDSSKVGGDEADGYITDGFRIDEFNYLAADTINRLKGTTRYIAWMGGAHALGFHSTSSSIPDQNYRVLGVAELTHTPSVLMISRTSESLVKQFLLSKTGTFDGNRVDGKKRVRVIKAVPASYHFEERDPKDVLTRVREMTAAEKAASAGKCTIS